jgi:hypothetical protein
VFKYTKCYTWVLYHPNVVTQRYNEMKNKAREAKKKRGKKYNRPKIEIGP